MENPETLATLVTQRHMYSDIYCVTNETFNSSIN